MLPPMECEQMWYKSQLEDLRDFIISLQLLHSFTTTIRLYHIVTIPVAWVPEGKDMGSMAQQP